MECLKRPSNQKLKVQVDGSSSAKKAAKLAKFQAKQAKQDVENAVASASKKKEKVKPTIAPVEKTEFVNTTLFGEKKDVSGGFPATYQPKAVEAAWYAWWEKCGFFEPELDGNGNVMEEGTYVIPIPPPNVTGNLHLGHALNNSIMDVMARW